MKRLTKILTLTALFLFAAMAWAQVNNPGVRYVSSAPSGACSQSPPVQVLNSSGAIYTCDNGTWAVQAGGSGSGTVSAGWAGQLAGYGANGTTVEGMQNQCPFVTDPPYNAACDGSTDDSAAIQAAMDANGCIQAPLSTGGQQQCNYATGLIQNNPSLLIRGNGSVFNYTGSGSGFSISSGGSKSVTITDLLLGLSGATGTPTELDFTLEEAGAVLTNVFDEGDGPTGYTSVSDQSGFPLVLTNVTLGSESLSDLLMVVNNSYLSTNGDATTLNIGVYTFNNTTFNSDVTLAAGSIVSGLWEINGTLALGNGTSFVTGVASVTSSYTGYPSTSSGCLMVHSATSGSNYLCSNPVQTVIFHSAGSNPLAAASSSNVGTTAWVTDAAALTPGTAYVVNAGAGTDTVQVQCTFDGSSTYAWKTM